MKITKTIIKIAHSLGIIIDKPIRDKMDINEGDMVEVDLKKVDNPSSKDNGGGPNKYKGKYETI